jgi:predicted Rossmann fold nucleotide-binding protein DprA/Smf involved in DNA uptake
MLRLPLENTNASMRLDTAHFCLALMSRDGLQREAMQLHSELEEKENLARAELNRVSQEKLDLRRAKNHLLQRMDKARKHIEKSQVRQVPSLRYSTDVS